MNADQEAVASISRRHGIALTGDIEISDLGLDFRVAFGADEEGRDWVLRIPRRADVLPRAENEARVLGLLKHRLPVAVPDWRVFTPELIAYPRLPGTIALRIDPETGQPHWNIDPEAPVFTQGLAEFLAALHGTPEEDAAAAGLRTSTPAEVRTRVADSLDRVGRELGISDALRRTLLAWLDDRAAWPPFTALVHGDLYAGHVTVDETARITGVLDWTEAEVADPTVDMVYHLMAFGEPGLERLLAAYEAAGGRIWPGIRRQVAARLSAVPLQYALFALSTGSDEHLAAARTQLGIT